MIDDLKTETRTGAQQKLHLNVACVNSLDDLRPFGDRIDALTELPFLQSTWMFPWIETHCSQQCKLYFLVVENTANEVIGFAPLVLRDSLKRGRHFGFVGSGKTCADYMTFPAKSGFENDVNAAIVQWLLQHDELWDRIELDGVEASNQRLSDFVTSMKRERCRVGVIETLPSFRMKLPTNWDELLGSLSKNNRKKYRRQARALEGKSQLHEATDTESLVAGMRILEQLHTARWNSLGQGGCFATPGFGEFLNRMAKEKLEAGNLSLIWLTYQGKPIAADIGYFGEGGLFTYQGGISPDHLDLDPGRAIIKCQMETAMRRGANFMDFLRGDEPYKSRFDTRRIENVRFEIVGRSTRARIVHSMLQIGRAVKSLLG